MKNTNPVHESDYVTKILQLVFEISLFCYSIQLLI